MGKAPDLLAGLQEEPAQVTGPTDLLSQITEDDGLAWMPWQDKDQPDGIQGVITAIASIATDSKFGAVRNVPLISLRSEDDTVWTVRGYGTVVENQLNGLLANGLEVGDHFAIRYFGEKTGKGAMPYHNVKAVSVKSK